MQRNDVRFPKDPLQIAERRKINRDVTSLIAYAVGALGLFWFAIERFRGINTADQDRKGELFIGSYFFAFALAMAFHVIGNARCPRRWLRSRARLRVRAASEWIIGWTVVLLMAIAIFALLFSDFGLDIFSKFHGLRTRVGYWADVLGTGILASVGWALFWLKVNALHFYARAEIAFALASSYAAISKIDKQMDLASVLAIAASAYLIVRGLDNRKKAMEEK
jgi:hypothetical protein